jgi:hypothetical protein
MYIKHALPMIDFENLVQVKLGISQLLQLQTLLNQLDGHLQDLIDCAVIAKLHSLYIA